MKAILLMAMAALAAATQAAEPQIYMIGKVKILATTHTQAVLFYDKDVRTLADCQREIQRGRHGQWRYHHHKFDNPYGYQQRISYYCVEAEVSASPWYQPAPYDYVYRLDLRKPRLEIKAQNSYSDCLTSVRRQVADETSRFFCAKLSQSIQPAPIATAR